MLTNNKPVYVAFHVGRGGRSHNPGHISYIPGITAIQQLTSFREKGYLHDVDEDCNPLPDSEWKLLNSAGNTILEGREAVESPVGILDWDGEYDTDIVKSIEDCTEEEMSVLFEAYVEGDIEDVHALNHIQKNLEEFYDTHVSDCCRKQRTPREIPV